ncbi:DUF362 domain-containing protein [Candidatus Methanoperedens nitratireducens]|uniref:DUF362 domain-containing protein n=1 Tax=Candidatus Methanoperedens nitratireducens TaxID=1392998 RepID=A0A284VRX7_9EURY|nr:DUF362 domain-containing protein [Candidatus Methanoperedens nitroreducens]SNQ61959.1 conserved hypothetical protein [Candidatus Methanoperedens nitroreducens]
MVSRRELLGWLAALFLSAVSGCLYKKEIGEKEAARGESPVESAIKSKVYVIKTGDRKRGVKELFEHFGSENLSGKKAAVKANYNSADPFPASTHIDTLSAIVDELKGRGARVVMAERSGMGDTKEVLEAMGVMELAKERGFDVVILDELKGSEWIGEAPDKSRWKRGFLFPKLFKEADAVVQTCCLKTHRFGGNFTMSLKNSVGMVAAYGPDDGYGYMSELHSSRYQRQMIAEINTAYKPGFVIMDGIQGFSKGGPEAGTLIEPGIIIAGNDRVAIDAVGVAVLRIYGTTGDVSKGNVFEQEQIARAAELGIGASGAEDIEIIPVNDEAQDICSRIRESLGR